MNPTIDRALREARTTLLAGDARAARRSLLELHEKHPGNTAILGALAKVEEKVSGQKARPFGAAHMKRIMALRAQRQLPLAIEEMVSYAFLNLTSPLARNTLGALYMEAGLPEPALPHLAAAVKADPAFRDARMNLAVALLKLDRAPEAAGQLEAVLQKSPDHVPALRMLADAYERTRGTAATADIYRRLAQLLPDSQEIRLALAQATAFSDDNAEAVARMTRHVEEHPQDHRSMVNLGNVLSGQGRMAEAEALFRRAIAVSPRAPTAYFNLGRTITFRPDDPALPGLFALQDDRSLPLNEQVSARFAAAKAHEDLGDADASFANLAEGNRLRRGMVSYSTAGAAAELDDILTRFAPGTPALPAGALSPARRRPIFVLGMMRSGTTLTEQILSSHSQIYGAGEMETMNMLMWEGMQAGPGPFDAARLAHVRQAYLQDLDRLPGDEPFVVDKMPANFRCIGLIAKTLPEAKIIHMRRDPVAVCWSIYKTFFTIQSIGYAWDMTEVAEYYRLYERFMQRIAQDYPGLVLDVDYQELTEDPQSVVRRMLDFVGLPFEEACLAPQLNTRAVRTASSRQVRSGIYKGSSSKWRGFEKHMGPLLEALGEGATSA